MKMKAIRRNGQASDHEKQKETIKQAIRDERSDKRQVNGNTKCASYEKCRQCWNSKK